MKEGYRFYKQIEEGISWMVEKNEQVHDGGQSLAYYWNRCSGCQLQGERIEVGWKGNLEQYHRGLECLNKEFRTDWFF